MPKGNMGGSRKLNFMPPLLFIFSRHLWTFYYIIEDIVSFFWTLASWLNLNDTLEKYILLNPLTFSVQRENSKIWLSDMVLDIVTYELKHLEITSCLWKTYFFVILQDSIFNVRCWILILAFLLQSFCTDSNMILSLS